MKPLIWLVAIGGLGLIAFFWMSSVMTGDQGIGITLAYGNIQGDLIEVNAAVDMGITRREGPRIDPNRSEQELWEEWLTEHFDLRDDSGARVELKRVGQSLLMDVMKMPGAPDFFLTAKLRTRVQYSFDYIPRRAESARYRYTFVAPAEKTGMKRRTFELVDNGG